MTEAALLEVEGVSKHFGGLAAVDDLSFAVAADETFGIAGPNGAGKTTLFDVDHRSRAGHRGAIVLAGEEIQGRSSHGICHRGVARTFQIPAVFPEHTVLGNIAVGAYFGRRSGVPSFAFDDEAIERAREAAFLVGLEDKLGAVAGPLSLFDKKRLMIASAIATAAATADARRAGRRPQPRGDRRGARPGEPGCGSPASRCLIEHVMRALMAISDRVMVMNHGRLLFEGTPAEVQRHEEVIRVYLGTEQPRTPTPTPRAWGAPMLETRELCASYGQTRVLEGIDLTVGRRRGRDRDRPQRPRQDHPAADDQRPDVTDERRGPLRRASGSTAGAADRIAAGGLVHIPQGDLPFGDMTVEENLVLGAFPAADWRRRSRRLEHVFDIFPVLAERRGQRARTLSGGERRMLALGRGLMREAKMLMIDEPSLGLAPVIVNEVYRHIETIIAVGRRACCWSRRTSATCRASTPTCCCSSRDASCVRARWPSSRPMKP